MALVVLAMSGGVDSSVAAHLLQGQGHEVVGVFMRHGSGAQTAGKYASSVDSTQATSDSQAVCSAKPALPIISHSNDAFHKQGCCTASDAEDARQVADRLEIDFYALNLQDDFDRIMDYFVAEYASGRTPNPCVMCNHWIKFGRLFEYADSIKADYVATGHYARLQPTSDGFGLYRGEDHDKDQSYVLFGIEPLLFPRMLLPIGEYTKPQIRAMAERLGLSVANKRDSQEICFVSPGMHAEFVAQRRGTTDNRGQIVTTDGDIVGEHEGIERFTIGQRKGLGLALGEPVYVVHIDADSKSVTVGRHADLARRQLTANRANWLQRIQPDWQPCLAQIRYNSAATPARFRPLSHDRFEVTFDQPCFGVAPGQAVVCYNENRVMGGGWIE